MQIILNRIEQLQETQQRLRLNNREMAAELRVSEFWYSKLVNGKRPASDDLMLRLDELRRRENIVLRASLLSDHLNSGGFSGRVEEEAAPYGDGVASRFPEKQRAPSTRVDCERYVQQLFNNAELSEDPDAFPVILSRLKKQLPLDEWEGAKPTDDEK